MTDRCPPEKIKNCSTYPPYIYTTSAGAPVAASFRIPEKVVASADSAHYEAYGKIYRVNGSKKGKLFSKYKTIEHATAMWRMWCQPRINEPEAVDLGGTMSVANYYCSGEQPCLLIRGWHYPWWTLRYPPPFRVPITIMWHNHLHFKWFSEDRTMKHTTAMWRV